MFARPKLSALLFGGSIVCLLLAACSEYNLAPLPGYLGKEFLAVDLNNYDGSTTEDSADQAQYSVTVSNPTFSGGEADVSISQRGGDEAVIREDIDPGDLETFDLPRWDAEDTFQGMRAFFIESSVPVTAHQFNPANNVGVFSNDASMLIPLHSLGTRYRAACWPFDASGADTSEMSGLGDYVTIVASEGDTEVTVAVTADVLPGENVAAVSAGNSVTTTLKKYEVLQLQSDNGGTGRTDLTGSLITSNKPVAVFSGNECALIPAGYMACDHIEEQLLPVDAWGEHYHVVKFHPRNNETDVYRVLADEDGTTVDIEPEIAGMFPVDLDAGEYVEFQFGESFEVEANKPVAVIQYMTGETWADAGTGDPAMLMVTPEEQYIDEYIFLTPSGYALDYVAIVAPAGTDVTIDDDEIDEDDWEEFDDDEWVWIRERVDPGVHHLKASRKVGVVVYGYDQYVSYAYPGGAQLEPTNQEED